MSKIKLVASASIIFALISKFTGFLRDVLLSYFFGVSSIADAYMIAYTLPLLVVGLVGEAIRTGFIPQFTKITADKGIEKGYIFTIKLINILLISTSVIVISFLLIQKSILGAMFPGLSRQTFSLALKFTSISIWGIYFLFLSEVLTGISQYYQRFLKITLISLPMNIVMIYSFYLSEKISIVILPYGIILGLAAQLIMFHKEIIQVLKRYKIQIDFRDKNIRDILFLSIPVMLGVSVNQINGLVDMNMASSIQNGGIAVINYSNRINTLFHGVVALTIANMCYPIIASYVSQKNYLKLNEIATSVMKILTIICIPSTMLIIFYSKDIVTLLYGRGSFTNQNITQTSEVLSMYAIGILPIAYREILVRIFYSFNNTILPVISAVVGVIINIILNIILSNIIGLSGLALSSGLSAMISTILLFILLTKKYHQIVFYKIWINLIKVLFISLALVLPLFFIKHYISNSLLSMFLGTILYVGVYLVVLLLFRIVTKQELSLK